MAGDLGGRSWIRLENLEITHDPTSQDEAAWFREGVTLLGAPSSHIVLSRLYIHHLDEFGVDAQDVDDLQILQCRIEYCGFGAVGGPAGQAGGLRNVLIRDCTLSWSGHYYRGGDGTDSPYDRPDGFGIEPSTGPVLIEDTIAAHNRGDGLDSKADATTIRRCIVANNAADGVKLWGGGSRVENTLVYGRGDGNPQVTPWAAVVLDTTETDARFELVNVTVDDSLGSGYMMYVQYDHAVPIDLTVRNCIFRCTGPDCPVWIRDDVSLTLDHTLFWLPGSDTVLIHGTAEYTAGTIGSAGPGNLAADPLLVAPAWGSEGDYHLTGGSPAIDAGISTGAPSDDLDGMPRDEHPDLGAYEYAGAACTLSCAPRAPDTATVGSPVAFHAGLSTSGCDHTPTVVWRFGDGGSSTATDPTHVYTAAGTFTWSFSAAAEGASCSGDGTVTVSEQPDTTQTLLVPAVAHNSGASGTLWRTDLAVVNPTENGTEVTVTFSGEGTGAARSITLAPGAGVVWHNVLESLFGFSPGESHKGVILLASPVDLVAAARTYNDTGQGTFGQFIPALGAGDGLAPGETAYLPLVAGAGTTRVNIGAANLGTGDATVSIALFGADGEQVGTSLTLTVPPARWRQLDGVFQAAGAPAGTAAYATVSLTGSGGDVWAYASVIDGLTGDAVTVPILLP